jgi:hypothetical protein
MPLQSGKEGSQAGYPLGFGEPFPGIPIYKWEQNLQRSWEVVTEDKEGNIHVEREKASNRGSSKDSIQREDHDRDRLSCIRRGLIRYMVD